MIELVIYSCNQLFEREWFWQKGRMFDLCLFNIKTVFCVTGYENHIYFGCKTRAFLTQVGPSIPGNTTSLTKRSIFLWFPSRISRASSPLAASMTSNPRSFKARDANVRTVVSSSTSKITEPLCMGLTAVFWVLAFGAAIGSDVLKGIRSVNCVPSPMSLSTKIKPPDCFTIP